MLLEGKSAVIYGGAGRIGAAVAQAFAREGANVHLAGRTLATLEAVAGAIRSAGGVAETATVDALDAVAVDAHADAVAASAGGIDISFNLISTGDVQGTPLAEMSPADFEAPVVNRIRTQFLTARAAARHMIPQGSGVILTLGGSNRLEPLRDYATGGHQIYMGGTNVAFGSIDVFRRQLATELGPHGIRVLTLQTGGVPETSMEDWRQMMTQSFIATSMLKQAETLVSVADMAVFAASDLARSMTATGLNITYGRAAD